MKVVIDDVEYVEMSKDDFIATLSPAQRYKINGKWYEPEPPEAKFKVGDRVREDRGIGAVTGITDHGNELIVRYENDDALHHYNLLAKHCILRKVE